MGSAHATTCAHGGGVEGMAAKTFGDDREPSAASGIGLRQQGGGAGRGCQSSTRGVAVVTACFGRLCCGARSSFAPSASTASSTRRSVTKTNIISKYTYL